MTILRGSGDSLEMVQNVENTCQKHPAMHPTVLSSAEKRGKTTVVSHPMQPMQRKGHNNHPESHTDRCIKVLICIIQYYFGIEPGTIRDGWPLGSILLYKKNPPRVWEHPETGAKGGGWTTAWISHLDEQIKQRLILKFWRTLENLTIFRVQATDRTNWPSYDPQFTCILPAEQGTACCPHHFEYWKHYFPIAAEATVKWEKPSEWEATHLELRVLARKSCWKLSCFGVQENLIFWGVNSGYLYVKDCLFL